MRQLLKAREIGIPQEIIKKWQEILHVLADVIDVPSALIMKADEDSIRVFCANRSKNNPYRIGDEEDLADFYCGKVIRTKKRVLVTNVLRNKHLKNKKGIKLRAVSYLGFPLSWPHGDIFGTICVLDSKKKQYSKAHERLMLQFRELVESHLRFLYEDYQNSNNGDSEGKGAKNLLLGSEAHYRSIFFAAHEAIVLFDTETGELLDANQKMCDMFGYDREEALCLRIKDTSAGVPPYTQADAMRWLRKSAEEGQQVFDWLAKHKSGKLFWVEVNLKRVVINTKDCLLAIVREITERKQTEKNLRESEENYRLLVENQTDLVVKIGVDGRFQFLSPSYCEVFGKTEEEILGRDVMHLVHEEDREKTAKAMENLYKPPYRCYFEQRAMTREGWRWFAWAEKAVLDKKNNVVSIVGVGRDITERKMAEEEVNRKTTQLKSLYETGKKISSIISKDELLPWMAKQAAKLLHADLCNYRIREGDYLVRGSSTKEGMELMKKDKLKIGESLSGIIAKEKKALIVEDIREDKRYIKEHREIAKRLGYISFLGVPMKIGYEEVMGVISVLTKEPRKFTEGDKELLFAFADQATVAIKNAKLFGDLEKAKRELERWNEELEKKVGERTKELKELHAQLVQSERLAATGRLAGSIAHEINNPLQAIDSFISSVMKRADKRTCKILKLAEEGIDRIADIVKQLLTFHHPETAKIELVDINHVVKKSISLTKNQLYLSKVKIKEKFSPNLPKVRVSPQQTCQILLNIILNALDAMPNGGNLTIKTGKENGFVYIEVSDTGVGIPEELLGRIFEPFFTTKNKEKGTGLGLSISYGIVKACNGDILVRSEVNKGTTVTVRFPINFD